MLLRTRRSTNLQNTRKDDKDNFAGKEMERGGKVRKLRKKQDKRSKAANNGEPVGNRENDTFMLDAEHVGIGNNIPMLNEEDEQAAAGRCTKICETIYVGGRPDSPSSPTREAESIQVAGYEVDANPLLEENGMADPELDTAMLDAQDGDSGSNGITSPAGSYERVANTMEGVEHGEGKANPPIGRAGSNNHTEGDAPVQKTITGTAKAVEQIEANASARTGTETGNISLPDSCDRQGLQEMGVHLESGNPDKGNKNCSKQRDQTSAAKAFDQEGYINRPGIGKSEVEAHTPPEMDGRHFAKTSNLRTEKNIDSHSGSMAVTFTSINRVADTPFSFLTTAEDVTNPFTNTNITTGILMTTEKETDGNDMHVEGKNYSVRDEDVTIPDIHEVDRRGKRLRETSPVESSTEPRTREEVPTRKRRRVGEELPETEGQRPEELVVPINSNDERNTAELDGIGVLGSVNPSTRKVETDKQNSDTNAQEVSSDGEVEMAVSEGKTNNGQSNTEPHAMEVSGTVESASLKADTDRRNSDSDMHEVGRDPDVDMACPAEAADDEPREPELDGMESSGEVNPRSCEVETGKPISDTNMQEVRGDSEVGRAFPEGRNNNGQSNTELQDMENSGSLDYPSSATGTNKQNCDTNMPELGSDIEMGSEEMGGGTEAYMAISGEKTNDEQTNPELGVMESSGSVDNASLNTDTERQNRDSDMHEEQRKPEKLVVDVDSPLRSTTKKNGPTSVHIDAAQSPHSGQIGSPSEPESPLKQKENFMNFARISREDNLRRMELERYSVARLEMKHAKLLIDMINSLFNRKADMYYLLAFKMVLLIFPYTAWEHVRDRLPAMMSYATEDIKTGLEKRVADEVYTEYPSDKGVDERIICWNQRLELYKGIEHGTRTLLEPTSRSVRTCVGRRPSECSSLQAEIQEMAGDLNHCQKFQEYFSNYASRTAFIFQNPQLLRDEIRFVVSILRQLILREDESSEAMFRELEAVASDIATAREIGSTEATMRQDVVMDLLESDDEEITTDNDEKEGFKKRMVGDIRKQRILDDVKETVQHHQSKALNFEMQFNSSTESFNKLEREMNILRDETKVMEKGFSQLYFCFFGPAIPPSMSGELQETYNIILEKIKTDFNKSCSREAEKIQLLQQLKEAENEKTMLQNENQELRTQVEGIKTSYKGLEARLLPIDQNRAIRDWRVDNSTQNDKDMQMNDSPGFIGTPTSSLPDTGEDIEMGSFEGDDEINMKSGDGKNADGEKTTEDLRKERNASDKRETIEHSRPKARNLESCDIDSEKRLKSINRTLVSENMGLKDSIRNLEKLQKGKTEEFESQLRDCNKKAVVIGEKNDEMENDFRLLYFKIFGEVLTPSLRKPSDIIWEKLETEFKSRCNKEQEQVKLLEKEKALRASLEAESRKQDIRIQQLEQEFENVSRSLRQVQTVNIEAERSKSDIQAQLDAKTQSLSTLEYQFQQANKEKVSLKDINNELKTKVEGIENWYKCLEAKLLPIDKNREIQNWRVNSSTQSDKDTQTNDSDGFAGDSMPGLKEKLAAVEAQVKSKEENLTAVEQEKTDLLKTIEKLEEDIRTGRDENKTAHNRINELEVQLDIKSMNHQKAVDMQAQIVQLEQEIKSIQDREQSYKATIDEYENQIQDINNWTETRKGQITEVQQYLKDAETEVREQKKALVENMKELEAVKAEASNKEESRKSIEQEKDRLKETMEKMEQTTNEKDKKVGILNVRLQDAKKEIKDLTTTLATVNATLHKERISTACEIRHLSKIIENLEKTKGEYGARIDESDNLKNRLREVEEERTAVMNVQDAMEKKDETISRLRQDIEVINEGHASEIKCFTEEIRKLNGQIEQEQKGDSGVTEIPLESLDFDDKSCAIPGKPEVAIQELERRKVSGDKLVESLKRIENVYSTIESLPSRLEQVLTTHQQSASDGNANCAYLQLGPVAQAADDGILARLEIKVGDLKRAIDKQHISSQDNVESNKICHSVEEMSKLISRLNQQSEESAERLCKEISCLTEQTSQLNSDIKEKDIQYREVTNELQTRKINFESEFERLSEKLPVLEIEQLKRQIHELHEQIRLLGPELKDKNQDLGTLKKDVSDIKAKTMTREGDIIRESLPSDLRNIMSKLIEMEKAMTQQQIACDERRNPSHFTSTRNTQLDESNSFSKLQSQVIDLNRNIAQLCEKDRFMVEVQKLQSSATERDSKFSGLKDKMDWLVQEVGKLQRRMKDSEAEVHSRQGDMAEFLRLSSNAWINQKPAEEATSKPNRNQDRRDELDGLREELSQIEKNIMYFTSTFPPPSGQPFSAVLEERFLGKVPVTERLKLLIERVRHRIDDLQSSLAQAKLDDGRVIRPEKARSTFVPDTNEVVTPLSELNMEFLTPTDRESGAIPTPNGQRQSRSADGKHNADSTHGGDLPLSSPVSGLRPCVKSAFTQTGIQEASKTLAVEGHEVLHESADNPVGSRKLEEEHALGSDSVRTDLERLRASLIFHLCTMLFASKRTVDVERLREGSRIFSRRTIGKGNLELLEQVIKGYSEKSMKSRGANKELRKITYKGRKAFPDTLLKTYTTIFKTLLTLTQNLDINDPIIDSRRTKGLEAARLDKGTKIQRRTGKP
ncbi:hypothetical protein FocnCong_v020356 [Fusarium oxysporum f. sp. conglutinans]|nr:hypothetical protein FocnCong_v020356 [Fusarium oxysporum f. sp. conglutinans]KAH7459111.1 hypothetical protein FOMA001_g20300 [Fusarium oxysporum f. sp. matthiolae]